MIMKLIPRRRQICFTLYFLMTGISINLENLKFESQLIAFEKILAPEGSSQSSVEHFKAIQCCGVKCYSAFQLSLGQCTSIV